MSVDPLLYVGVFAVAVLYSAVGHAGASGYIAVMSLLALAPEIIKPTALALNILVALIASVRFYRAGALSWRSFVAFAWLAVPCAFLGGRTELPGPWFRPLVGIVLLYAALCFWLKPHEHVCATHPPAWPLAGLCGAVIGFLSGLTGTGGGIFLTPLLIFMGWASTRQAAAVSAVFILCNSMAGLAGYFSKTSYFPEDTAPLLVLAAVGGAVGSHLACSHFSAVIIKRLLACVLAIAGSKFIWF
jgi:uncharacterized protein